ncbi:glycoside hydrolase, partial [Setomelanomma holmii]
IEMVFLQAPAMRRQNAPLPHAAVRTDCAAIRLRNVAKETVLQSAHPKLTFTNCAIRFCGSTDDFCAVSAGCQQGFGGCGPPQRPSCGGGTSANKRTVGYYEAWSNTRKCSSVAPEDLNLNGFTHINFAFAFFDPSSFQIAPMDGKTGVLYNRFTGLKSTNQGLKTYISVGGWSFTDPGPTRTAFSTMASSSGNRAKFVSGLMSFMNEYGFDGVDLDWEYPQADDRGGAQGDKDNYVALVAQMRAAFGSKYGITVTLPTSYWYLQHFDLKGLQPNVDWFNLMSYDLHGIWDAQSKAIGPYIAPHTNITEIDLGLDLLWRAGVDPKNVVLGQGWYGRSFTLKDSSCNIPNGICQFSGGANPGPCSNAAGILDLQEIKDIVSKNNLKPTWDKVAGVKWINWDSNQWVSYDDDDTFQQKRDFANKRCLGGTMVWAMDQVDQKADNGLAPAPGVTTSDQEDAKQKSGDLAAGISCYTTDCNVACMKSTNQVAQMNGQPGQLSTNDRCAKGQYRNLCCASGTTMGKCQWRGYRGVGLSCMGGCADGETEIVKDTNNHVKKKDQDCAGGLQSFCCKGFKPAPNVGDLGKMAADAAKAAAAAAAEQAALDVAAKAFCRVAVPALLAPLELLEDLIPIVGEILDIAEIAATPALIQVCVKGVEKEGKAEFKVFGKKHTISMNSGKPSETRAPESKHTSAKTSSDSWTSCSSKAAPRADEPRPKRQCRRPEKHIVRTIALEDVDTNTKDVNLDCANNPQPCLHYRSVIQHNPATAYAVNTCPYLGAVAGRGPDLAAKTDWEGQHPKNKWRSAVSDGGLIPDRRPGHQLKGCEADEWPPYKLYHEVDGYNRVIDPAFAHRAAINKPQFIRYLDGTENGNVGNIWRCKEIPQRHSTRSVEHSNIGPDGTTTFFTDWTGVYTRTAYRINPVVADVNGDDGISANDCYPRGVDNDNRYQGYALLNDDPWYDTRDKGYQAGYKRDPVNAKRNWLDPEDIVFVADNSSRRITDEEYEELQHRLGFAKCSSGDCNGDDAMEGPVLIPTTLTAEGMQPTGTVPMPQDSTGDAKLPRETQSF